MDPRTPTGDRRWIHRALLAGAVVILVAVGCVAPGDDQADIELGTDSTTVPETVESGVDPFSVAYPGPTTGRRFETPESAGRSYATEVLGFTELVVGEYRAGDSRSGELPVTDREGGPETTILVRLMEDDTWFVLGSITADITVDEPGAGDTITSPFLTTGSALAFEGTVNVEVRTQEDLRPLGGGVVMGSGVPPAGPFEGTIEFDGPVDEVPGILIYREYSAEDGHVRRATSIPVRLAGGGR